MPGIQLPAVVGACRILLHHAWEGSSAQEALDGILAQLVQMLCRVEGVVQQSLCIRHPAD